MLLSVSFKLMLFLGYIAKQKLFIIDVGHVEVSTN